MENKRKRGRPRKVVAPQKPARPSALYIALAKADEVVARKFRHIESMQNMTGANQSTMSKLMHY